MNEQYFQQEIANFEILSKASVDTSSIITLDALKLLELLLSALEVLITPGVMRELGTHSDLGIRLKHNLADIEVIPEYSVDQEVIQLARNRKIAIISEDRKVLQKAETLGLPILNSGLAISFLVFSKKIDFTRAHRYWKSMRSTYPYRKDLDSYCQDLLNYLERSL